MAIAVAVLAIARELGVLLVPLPQVARQTKDIWAKVFHGTLTAALWGLDLGLIFTTWLTFSGVWLLVIVTILTGESSFGATLFVLYWLGRALSVWLTPLLLQDASATSLLLGEITRQQRLFQRIHAVGLAWSVVVLIAWFAYGPPM